MSSSLPCAHFFPERTPGDAHADISSPARLRNIWARSKTILKHFNMSGMRNEGNHLDYRVKIAHHLKLFYGKTFKEGSYWYKNPNENEFFRAVFAKAAGKENADDVDAAGIEDIFFKKENRQTGIDAKALGRYCSERQLKALFSACPASSEEGDVCIEVPAPASASLGAPVKSDEEDEEDEEKETPNSGSPVPAVHGEAGTGEPAESDDEGTVAHEADVANLHDLAGEDDLAGKDDAVPAMPAGGDFDDGNFYYSDEKKFKESDDFNLDGFTASQWDDDVPPPYNIFEAGLSQPSQPTNLEPTEQQRDLLEYLMNASRVNEWCVRLSQLKVGAAEGKIITGWTPTAVDRRARAMKCFEELERIMREQDQAYDVDFDDSFPVASTTLG